MPDRILAPPFWFRLTGRALRGLPQFRGRARIEAPFHHYASERGWRDEVTVNGYWLAVSLDDLIGRSIYLAGTWERANTLVVRRLLRPGGTVFDVGANIGYFSLLFANLVGPEGQVVSFEPVPETAAALRRNLELNPQLRGRVQVHQVALSDVAGEVAVAVAGGPNSGASHVVADFVYDPGRLAAGVQETAMLACRTGDEIWEEVGRPAVDLVKVDVEGHELHALRGMRGLLQASEGVTVLVEVRDSFLRAAGGSSAELYDLLGELGLLPYEFLPREGTFRPLSRVRDGELVVFSRRRLVP